MNKRLATLLCILAATTVLADQITLSDGSVINGTLKSITGGKATVKTDFAGEITFDAGKIVKLNTSSKVEIATDDGTRISGIIKTREDAALEPPAPVEEGAEAPKPAAGPLSLPLSNVKFLWTEGMEDPTLPPSRKWDGEFTLDIAGKTGNTEKFNGGAGVTANLVGPIDRLKLYANASYGRENHNTNTKKYLAGADYEHKLNETKALWYLNGELEQQTTSGLRLRQEAGGGFGYYFFEDEATLLRARGGLAAKARKYTDGSHADAVGAQFSLHYERNIQEWGKLVTDITYQPTLDDIHDYRILHESSIDIPVVLRFPMNLRIGISNEYNSRVARNSERLETSYFAKMVFKWK